MGASTGGRVGTGRPRVLHSPRLNRTAAHQAAPEDPATTTPHDSADLHETDLLGAAFRDLHGARLHGFALLLSLGDGHRAARAAAEVLEQGARQAAELRHPERAAAWLRARVLLRLRRGSSPRAAPAEPERRAALRRLGAADPVFDGLAALSMKQRAALVASTVERFDPIDVETIIDEAAGSSFRLVARARERYLAAVSAAVAPHALDAPPGGELGDRIREVAGRAMGTIDGGAR